MEMCSSIRKLGVSILRQAAVMALGSIFRVTNSLETIPTK